jgi:hypothetical protein
MKRILMILGLVGFIGAANAAEEFLPNFEDIPLMEGVVPAESDGFLFSVAEGKIVETLVASDTVSRREFQKFYTETLKNLGWELTDDGRKKQEFSRGEDVLTIEILSTDPLEARFLMMPSDVPDVSAE